MDRVEVWQALESEFGLSITRDCVGFGHYDGNTDVLKCEVTTVTMLTGCVHDGAA